MTLFDDDTGPPAPPAAATRPSPRVRTTTARPVTPTWAERVTASVAEWASPFTANEIMACFGGHPRTVQNLLDGLVAAGRIENLGPVDRGRLRPIDRYQTRSDS
jgi:hypothetical protein